MDKIVVENTTSTPRVEFDPTQGLIKLEGRSIPENPGDFYEPLMEWITQYFREPKKKTRVDLNLEYINSGSSKNILGLLRLLKTFYDKKHDLEVNWFYEEDDEAVLGLGEHYKSTIAIPINLIEFI